MAISITDNERATMATAVRKTMSKLDEGDFAADVLVDSGASRATSKISSIYKRHGTILQKALAIAIATDPAWEAWDELPLSHKDYPKGLKLDLVLYGRGSLRIFEVKRGLGKQDSDAKKGITNRLTTASNERSQIFKNCGIQPINNVKCGVVSYYGKFGKAKGIKQFTRDGLESEFAGLSKFIDEVDDYLKFLLGNTTVGDFAQALGELDVEIPQEINEAVARRKARSHPWDNLGV
jgi:hypothetical protein